MKTTLFLIFAGIISLNAQVALGKNSVDGSAILDFKEDLNKGIILPWVDDTAKITHSGGTLLYKTAEKKVQWFNGSKWNDLSVHSGTVDLAEISNWPENTSPQGVIIGDTAGAASGVLVLNKPHYALVLPKSKNPWENIPQPEAGTLLYDTTNNLVCIFNGTEWTFWGK